MTFLETEQTLDQLKEAWYQQWFSRSGSFNSRQGAEKSMRWLERFIFDTYQGKPEKQILEDLKLVSTDPAKSTQLYLFINSFVQYLNTQKKAVRTIRIYTMFVKNWLRYNGIKVYSDDMKQFVTFPKLVRERRQPITVDMISKLLFYASDKYKALILCLVSSGCRIGELLQAKVSDFDLQSTPVRFRIRAETTKTREERESCISQQALVLLKPFIEGKKPDALIFFETWTKDTLPNVEKEFANIRKQAGFVSKYSNGISQVNIHAFRSFFFTKASKKHGDGYAHAMIGHHAYLEQYFRETPEEQAKQYLELEPELTITIV